MILIYIFLVINEIEHLSTRMLTICLSFLEKCLFKALVSIKKMVACLFFFVFENSQSYFYSGY